MIFVCFVFIQKFLFFYTFVFLRSIINNCCQKFRREAGMEGQVVEKFSNSRFSDSSKG